MAPPYRLLAVVIAALVAVSAAVVACSDEEEAAPPTTTSTTVPSVADALAALELEIVRADVIGPAAPVAPLADDVRRQIATAVETFLEETSARPILTGRPARGWGVLLTPEALERAKAPDRAALVDDGVPRSTRLRPDSATIAMTALADAAGHLQLAVADVDWNVLGTGGHRNVRVHRSGEVTLVPTEGGWLISAYDLHVRRKLGQAPATTTTVKGGG